MLDFSRKLISIIYSLVTERGLIKQLDDCYLLQLGKVQFLTDMLFMHCSVTSFIQVHSPAAPYFSLKPFEPSHNECLVKALMIFAGLQYLRCKKCVVFFFEEQKNIHFHQDIRTSVDRDQALTYNLFAVRKSLFI